MGSALQSSSMKVVAALTVLSLLAAPAMSKNLGSINVKDYGEVYVCAPDWASGAIQMHDNGFTMNGNSRLYFCSSPVDGWDPNAYWQTPLNNKHFAYTLDLSNVGCHCNAAAYFINMPGNNPGDGGDYYCDANLGNNIWCPEYDTMEGNKHTIATTLHTCNGGNGYWDSCDRGGCMVFPASLWGGGGIDMGWLDGMTGCGGECNIDGSSVTFTNFELWE